MRDNVLIETGLAAGILGLERTILLVANKPRPRIPTNLAGLQHIEFDQAMDERELAGFGGTSAGN